MKVSKTIIATVILFCLSAVTTQAQVSLQAGFGLGYVMAGGEYKGSPTGYYNGTNYGMDNGFNIHGKARVGLLSFVAAGEINYLMLSSDGELSDGVSGSADVTINVLSIRIGPEFHFGLPIVPIDPYVGANFQINTFSGSVEFQGVTHVATGTTDIESSTRYGFGINGGVVFSLGSMKLDVNLSYNMLNLFGKEFTDAGDQRVDSYKNLNDDSDPDYSAGDDDHFIFDSRSLGNMEIKATLMFGL